MTYFPEPNFSKIDCQQNQMMESSFNQISVIVNKIKNIESWIHPHSSIRMNKETYRLWSEKNTVLLKSDEKKIIFEIDIEKKFPIILKENGLLVFNLGYYVKLENPIESCDAVEIHTNNNKVRLPEKISLNLIKILNEKRISSFCCFDLVSALFDKFKRVGYFDINEWTYNLDDSSYLIGDAVALCNYEELEGGKTGFNFLHFAVNVGDDNFISLYGGESPIIFSSMEDMKKIYKTSNVLKLNPSSTHQDHVV